LQGAVVPEGLRGGGDGAGGIDQDSEHAHAHHEERGDHHQADQRRDPHRRHELSGGLSVNGFLLLTYVEGLTLSQQKLVRVSSHREFVTSLYFKFCRLWRVKIGG